MRKLMMDELGRLSTEEFLSAEKLPLTVVLDNVRSGLNVGSIFRTADSFLLERMCLCGYTASPPHRDVLKTALGSTDTIPWESFPDTVSCVEQLKSEGYKIWAVEQVEGSVSLPFFMTAANEKVAVVFGNEVLGVEEDVLKLCDGAIEVPQWGMKHSLNVGVCAGIVLWEIVRKWRFSK